MDLTKTPTQLASEAAEAVRALNHRTLDPKSFDQPGDASDVADAVRTLTERLPQLLTQLGAGLARFDETQAIRMDDGSDPVTAVAECKAALDTARAQLIAVTSTLGIVTARASHMGGHWDAADED